MTMRQGRPPLPPVEIVVPVYNAAEDLARCVDSVLAHTAPEHALVLIDDASPDPAIAAYFDSLRVRELPNLTLLRNEHNLGFTGTANRGMTRSRADIVLLNSDTIVTAGWLEALRRCAASSAHIGTVTPMSNNAEIVSFPRFCANNRWPADADPEPVRAALERAAVPTYPELPTGVGFCMYVRRELIDAIGVFDTVFGAGYGEENDFCLRGFAVGYRNALAEDAFVLHTGERSFEGQKRTLGERNAALLVQRHPHYDSMVAEYIAVDPLAPLRQVALGELAKAEGGARGVLHVIHHHGGGTETYVRALIEASRTRWRHYLAIAIDDEWQVEDHAAPDRVGTYRFERGVEETTTAFLGSLCATFAIGLIHVHNISGDRFGLVEALPACGLPYGYTTHDLSFACPTITLQDETGVYCGGVTDVERCSDCLAAQPVFHGIDIAEWRRRHATLVSAAAFVISPSRWAADMFGRYFPSSQPQVIPHGVEPMAQAPRSATPVAVLIPEDEVPTVALLGAIGPDKGARRMERLVELARQRDLPLRFVLIGYYDRQRGPWQSEDARLIVHGRYEPGDLPRLLDHYRARLVLFPSEGPETFAYTLSEAWLCGRPVLVPPLGALAERVQGSGAGWLMTQAEWRDEAALLDRLLVLCDDGAPLRFDATRLPPSAAVGPLAAMTEATLARYDAVPPPTANGHPCFSRERVRDAAGYRTWYPLVKSAPRPRIGAEPVVGDVPSGAVSRLRDTLFGRLAVRLAPRRVRTALRSHFR